ncbi:glycerate kinase [Diaminobutyricimonas aerilata]|uniref:glycerate kinase n=1 Tax=Diaminobutyricimonas aerilata TaxID=1162967 RepID=UPI0012FDB628|nr:glycerate kinase [Diaminobutyricimonas aerilata]
MRVVIAPDSFKGSLTAREVAAAIAAGWREQRPDDELVLVPLADGGEGTLDAMEQAMPDAARRSAGTVTGPDGRPVAGEYLALPGGVAVVELAQSSGLPLMGGLDPLHATTRGLGEVIGRALDDGATSIVVGLGGSASTDGGAGALRALGLRLLDEHGADVSDGGAALLEVRTVDRSGLRPIPGGVTLLSDVTAPLLGPTGAAAVFGPQKGAAEHDVALLDRALAHFASLLGGDPSVAGTGAAGGTGFGLLAAYDARIVSGADHLAALVGLPERIAASDLVLSGEGRFDEQSLGGKIVGRTLATARAAGVPAGVIAGQITTAPPQWGVALTAIAGSVEQAIAEPAKWLEAAGRMAARELG